MIGAFVAALAHSARTSREAPAKSNTTTARPLDVVVAGGGPAGLLHAVGAALHGYTTAGATRVTVLEQRARYSRNRTGKWGSVLHNTV